MSSERFWTGVCHGALILGILCLWVLSLGWIELEGRSQGRAEQEAKDKANAPKDWTEAEREECAKEISKGFISYSISSAAYDEKGDLMTGPSWNISCSETGVSIVEAPKHMDFGGKQGSGIYVDGKKAYVPTKPHKAAPKRYTTDGRDCGMNEELCRTISEAEYQRLIHALAEKQPTPTPQGFVAPPCSTIISGTGLCMGELTFPTTPLSGIGYLWHDTDGKYKIMHSDGEVQVCPFKELTACMNWVDSLNFTTIR